MAQYTLLDAQERLPELISQALQGSTVQIMDEQHHIIQLVPISTSPQKRQAGSARGLIRMADDFDAPLDDFASYIK